MRSVYALIPAALLAGTFLATPAYAKSMDDPAAHAQRVINQKKNFKTYKKHASVKKPFALGKAKARKVAALKKSKTAKVKTSRLVKLAKVEKTKLAKGEKLTKVEKSKLLKTAKLAKIEKARPRKSTNDKVAGFELPKVALAPTLRSGPRRIVKLEPVKKTLPPKEAPSDTQVAAIIREMSPAFGVPTWFALRIADVESGYNPFARGRAGEIGVYQLKCQTARGMGFSGECSALTNARVNVRWGLKHLSLAIQSAGGNLKLAASKHNGGLARKSLVHSYIAKVF